MRKLSIIIPQIVIVFSLAFFACHKKKDQGNGPGFKDENGTGGNPFVNQTTTSSPTSTNPAIQNSSLLVGGVGWTNPSCASTQSLVLKGLNGTVEVTLTFLNIPVTGNYSIAPQPSANQACSMSVVNAPNQPAGVTWYAKSGVVSVVYNTSSNSISASFAGIPCFQDAYTFPQVTVSGNLGCN